MKELKIWNTVHCPRCKELLGHTTDPNGIVLDYEHSNSGSCDNLMRGPLVTQPEKDGFIAKCHPLPDYRAAIEDMPLLDDDEDMDPDNISSVSNEEYLLWVTRFLQQNTIDHLLSTDDTSDLRRLWHMLQMTHRRVHNMLDRASQDPSALVGGFYLTLVIMHEGVRRMMAEITKKLVATS